MRSPSRLEEVGPLDDAKIVDLEERDGRYYFRIQGSERGFSDALSAIKMIFEHGTERSYNPETREWSVPTTDESERGLCAIFGNAARAFQALHSQLSMWDDGGDEWS